MAVNERTSRRSYLLESVLATIYQPALNRPNFGGQTNIARGDAINPKHNVSSDLAGTQCSATEPLSKYILTYFSAVSPAACFPGTLRARLKVVLRRVRRELQESAHRPILGTEIRGMLNGFLLGKVYFSRIPSEITPATKITPTGEHVPSVDMGPVEYKGGVRAGVLDSFVTSALLLLHPKIKQRQEKN